MQQPTADIKKAKQGGARPGAGRKKKDAYEIISISVPVAQLQQIQAAKIEDRTAAYVKAMDEYLQRNVPSFGTFRIKKKVFIQ